MQWRQIQPTRSPSECVYHYNEGLKKGLWSNAEEYLDLLDRARSDAMTQAALSSALGATGLDPVQHWTLASQYFAIATSYFVDRVRGMSVLPDAWIPYLDWDRILGSRDTIVSFNYDLVVEEAAKRTENDAPNLIKLHGTVPDAEKLKIRVGQGSAIDTIATPGPNKVVARNEHLAQQWADAEKALKNADRLVVLGYSFSAADASASALVLKASAAAKVTIVLGKDPIGEELCQVFSRLVGRRDVTNTKLLAEQFLAEGSARPKDGRFDHELFEE
jgi:hypothetical protein